MDLPDLIVILACAIVALIALAGERHPPADPPRPAH